MPPVVGWGNVNIFHCQFPCHTGAEPTPEERTRLAGYASNIVSSHYTAAHVHAALSALCNRRVSL